MLKCQSVFLFGRSIQNTLPEIPNGKLNGGTWSSAWTAKYVITCFGKICPQKWTHTSSVMVRWSNLCPVLENHLNKITSWQITVTYFCRFPIYFLRTEINNAMRLVSLLNIHFFLKKWSITCSKQRHKKLIRTESWLLSKFKKRWFSKIWL